MNAEKMKFRTIRGMKISAVGYGAMGLSHGYGACPDHNESIRLLNVAVILLIQQKFMVGEKMKDL